MIYDIIIIGAGPAGLMASIFSKGKVVLLDGNQNLGKKLLITGAGQCNFTHAGDINEFLTKYGKNGRFLKAALYNFNNKDTVEFFSVNDIESIENESGKIFPKSLKSTDILDALIGKCKENNISIKSDRKVKEINIKKIDDDFNQTSSLFYVKTNKECFAAKKIIVATGGKSFDQTGSDGSMFSILKELGISVESLYPSLTPIYVKNYRFAHLSGISFKNAIVNLYRDNKKIESNTGDILLTHKNISGPGILDFSRYVRNNDLLKINFIGINENVFRNELKLKIDLGKDKTVKSVVRQLDLPNRFIDQILEEANISSDLNCSSLKKSQFSKFVDKVCNYNMTVECLGDFNIAMVTSGGVKLSSINKKTMESKEIPGLYFAGEVLDIDGDTGGYNIQAAFSTGRLAAINASKNKS